VALRLNRTGTLDLIYGETAIFGDLPLPIGGSFVANRFGLGARTGGLNDNHWLDDIRLALNTQPPLRRLSHGWVDGTLTLSWEPGAQLQSAPSVLGPWSDVPGATSPYITPQNLTAEFFRLFEQP
jgi:hypothetical protein